VIVLQQLSRVSAQDVPQRDIRMAGGGANRLCHSQEQRVRQEKVRRYTQLFPQFTLDRR